MASIKFYGPQNTRYGGKPDGDIQKKVRLVQTYNNSPFFRAKVRTICNTAMHEWLDRVNPAAPIPDAEEPFSTDKIGNINVPDEDGTIRAKIEKLKAALNSNYQNMDNNRIHVIGLNAWLDAKMTEYRISRK